MKVIDGISQVDEYIEEDALEFTLKYKDEDDMSERKINAVMTYAEDEDYKCFPISESGVIIGFKALKIMQADVLSIGEKSGHIMYKIYLMSVENVDHTCIIRLKSGRFVKPISGAQARRAVKEGSRPYHIDIIGPTNEKPKVGEYYMYRDAIVGPYNGSGGESTLYYGGSVVASTDRNLNEHPNCHEVTQNIIDYIVNSPIIPLEIYLMRDSMRNIWVNDEGEIEFKKVNSYYTRSELEHILLEVMNLGMNLRQHQLDGSNLRSGKDVLNQWKNENL